MSTPTPRTDGLVWYEERELEDFARQLERELTEANDFNEKLKVEAQNNEDAITDLTAQLQTARKALELIQARADSGKPFGIARDIRELAMDALQPSTPTKV